MTRDKGQGVLWLGERIKKLPVIHGSGDFSLWVRDELLAQHWDCLAVPLPPSFQEDVEQAVLDLPRVTAVVQEEPREASWSAEGEGELPEVSEEVPEDESGLTADESEYLRRTRRRRRAGAGAPRAGGGRRR